MNPVDADRSHAARATAFAAVRPRSVTDDASDVSWPRERSGDELASVPATSITTAAPEPDARTPATGGPPCAATRKSPPVTNVIDAPEAAVATSPSSCTAPVVRIVTAPLYVMVTPGFTVYVVKS